MIRRLDVVALGVLPELCGQAGVGPAEVGRVVAVPAEGVLGPVLEEGVHAPGVERAHLLAELR